MHKISSVILASGSQRRWDGNYPKQLLSIGGETLLSRMRRQMIIESNVYPSIITDNTEIIHMYAGNCYIPNNSDTVIDSLMSSSALWGEITYVLLGDVYYTKKAIDILTTAPHYKIVFGDEVEIFALRFYSSQIIELISAAKRAKAFPAHNSEFKLWNLYRALEGYRDDEHKLGSQFCLIEDDTQDFDCVEDYLSFMDEKSL